MSGFFVGPRMFITAGHFDPQDPESMKKSDNKLTHISTARFSEFPDDPTVKTAFLVYLDRAADFALFKLTKNETDAESYLDINDLHAAKSDPYNKFETKVVWIVGYNGADPTQAYENFAAAYFNALSPIKKVTLKKLSYAQTPDFEHIFRPNERSLGIGRLSASNDESASLWNHSISGWYGVSDAMIGIIKKPRTAAAAKSSLFGSKGLTARIIGFFQGGEYTSEWNQMVAFDEGMLQTIKYSLLKEEG